jgi:hypothetical protein
MTSLLRFATYWFASVAFAADPTLTTMVLGAPLSIRACPDFAGAICSLTWKGKEFINAYDHGRELQSASSFDQMGECFNPTEAGSEADGTQKRSSSVLVRARATAKSLSTRTQMAFWLKPGQNYPQGCDGRPEMTRAQNATALSQHLVSKQVSIGHRGLANVIRYDVEFEVPKPHDRAVFEALTGYMPEEFSRFWTLDPASRKVEELLVHRQGEQPLPLIFSTTDQQFAMGIYAPGLPQATYPSAGYGRFRFTNNPKIPNWNTVKWNCAYRFNKVRAGKYRFRCFVVVGSQQQVADSMLRLSSLERPKP